MQEEAMTTESEGAQGYEDVTVRLPDRTANFLHRLALDADTDANTVASVLFSLQLRTLPNERSLPQLSEEILIAEISRLRDLAGACYAGLVAACDLPNAWADAFLAASEGKPFSVDGLLPYVRTEGQVDD